MQRVNLAHTPAAQPAPQGLHIPASLLDYCGEIGLEAIAAAAQLWQQAEGQPKTLAVVPGQLAAIFKRDSSRARSWLKTLEAAGLVDILDRSRAGVWTVFVDDPAARLEIRRANLPDDGQRPLPFVDDQPEACNGPRLAADTSTSTSMQTPPPLISNTPDRPIDQPTADTSTPTSMQTPSRGGYVDANAARRGPESGKLLIGQLCKAVMDKTLTVAAALDAPLSDAYAAHESQNTESKTSLGLESKDSKPRDPKTRPAAPAADTSTYPPRGEALAAAILAAADHPEFSPALARRAMRAVDAGVFSADLAIAKAAMARRQRPDSPWTWFSGFLNGRKAPR